jgi:hypothetical protein
VAENTACENVGNFRKNDRIKPEEDRLETIYGRKWQEIVPAFLNRQEKNNIRSPLASGSAFLLLYGIIKLIVLILKEKLWR